jgi:hypothetical protein
MRSRLRYSSLLSFLLSLTMLPMAAMPAAAQSSGAAVHPGTMAGEASVGYAAFLDDGAIDHGGVAGAMRVHLTPRISVGPELAFLVGPGRDRDVVVLGNVTFDIRRPAIGVAGRVEPYLVIGAGLLAHTDGRGWGVGRAVAWGGGARVWLGRRVYWSSDVRMGWTPHVRVSSAIGVTVR